MFVSERARTPHDDGISFITISILYAIIYYVVQLYFICKFSELINDFLIERERENIYGELEEKQTREYFVFSVEEIKFTI